MHLFIDNRPISLFLAFFSAEFKLVTHMCSCAYRHYNIYIILLYSSPSWNGTEYNWHFFILIYVTNKLYSILSTDLLCKPNVFLQKQDKNVPPENLSWSVICMEGNSLFLATSGGKRQPIFLTFAWPCCRIIQGTLGAMLMPIPSFYRLWK